MEHIKNEHADDDKIEPSRQELAVPTFCPMCGGTDLALCIVEWFSHSLEPHDVMNCGIFNESQCHDCGAAFWT